jgi:outer membrane protein TolC
MIALLLLASLAFPQDTTRLTLSQVIDRTLASYPTLAAARAQRDHVAADVGDARATRLPRLSLDGQVFQYQKPNVIAPLHGFDPAHAPIFDQTLIQSGVSFNWTVLDFGNRAARVRAAKALESAAEASVSTAELQLTERAVNSYLRVLTARDVLRAQDQRLSALASASDRVRQLLAEGKAARVDQLRVDAERKRSEADRIGSASQLDVAEHELGQLTQLPYEVIHAASLPALSLADTASADADRAALVARAHESSTEVKELEQRARAADAGLSAAKATWFPELRVAGAYVDRGRWLDDFSAEWQVGVAMSYPLFTGGSRQSAIRRAGADDRAVGEQLKAAQLNVEQGIDRTLASLHEAHARVAALQTAVEQSAEVSRIERLSLDVGSGTQTQYLDAEANLLRARASLIEAQHAEISARVELARLTGELSSAWLARTVESGQ